MSAGLLVVFSGCAAKPASDKYRTSMEAVLQACKATSLDPWPDKDLLPAAGYQTATMLEGAETVELAGPASATKGGLLPST